MIIGVTRQWTVRAAVPADVERLAQITVAAWRVGYRGIVPAELLARLRTDVRAVRIRAVLGQTLVAEDEGGAQGFVRLDLVRGEVAELHVNPASWRTGAGTVLLRAAQQRLAEHGYERPTVWTFEANVTARQFYERRGWRCDGVVRDLELGAAHLTEIRYSRASTTIPSQSTG